MMSITEKKSASLERDFRAMPKKDCDEEDYNKDKFEWTLAKYILLFELSIVFFFNFASFSILATFFPNEATSIGATRSEIGFIFGAYPLVAFPASLIYGILIPRFGAEKLLLVGIFTNGITVFLFAFVNLTSSSRLFVGFCLTLRVLAALGGAACETTIRAIILTDFGSNIGFTMGILSTATELAFTVGPVLGGALYTVGGFKLPFLAVGSLFMLLLFLVCIGLPKKEWNTKQTPIRTLTKALSIPGVAMMALVQTILITDLSVLDPTLAPYIYSIHPHLSAGVVGLIFLLNGAVVALLSPLAGWICDKTGANEIVLTSGLVVGGISLLLIGPAPFLTSFLPTKKLWLICLAVAINGGSAALTIPPSVTVMSMYARGAGMPEDLATNGVISGIVTASANLGSFAGPAFGGIVIEWIGFSWCMGIFGLVSLFQAVTTGVFTYFYRASKPNGGENYSEVDFDE
ncbi:MFS-type transporter SLC18B1-like [Actinia tenebrosa]|uniref:MFS-type transporter SLC18B1-like n=1 Tax=Actinia tenebrosa TaxID=6105 RepID=A0A6P8H246_ACTTE|nr:MFS-type transporter SLC18B1-like [Actinia tenebrosa]